MLCEIFLSVQCMTALHGTELKRILYMSNSTVIVQELYECRCVVYYNGLHWLSCSVHLFNGSVILYRHVALIVSAFNGWLVITPFTGHNNTTTLYTVSIPTYVTYLHASVSLLSLSLLCSHSRFASLATLQLKMINTYHLLASMSHPPISFSVNQLSSVPACFSSSLPPHQ